MGHPTEIDTPRQNFSTRLRRWAGSLGPFDYAATIALIAVYVVGTSMDEGPGTSMDFWKRA